MPLVEVCPVPATLPSALALGVRWVESLGNVPVVMEKEAQGFIVNRIQCACLREALHIVEQGWASPETVDKAISLSLGRRYFATGPIESADMAGLEIFSTVLSQLSPALGTRTDPGPLMSQAMEQGHLGLKTGKGIYEWPPEVLAARRNAREQSLIAFLKQTQALRETKG